MTQYVAETCEVTCIDNNKTVLADILDFKQEKILIISLNKSVKLSMPFNGILYEGKMSGLTFISDGPKITTVKTGR